MQAHIPEYCLIERRNDSRRQHFDRRDKARFEPQHPDRRAASERRLQTDSSPKPTPK